MNVDGTFYAVDNTCPHAGGPLGEGKLSEEIVECPWHGWRFNIRTGERVSNNTVTVACCPARIEGDQILIVLPPSLTPEPRKEAASSAGRSDPAL
jgi:nitrite reductase (NADH) small subunit/3-phenylpropionate/trans-cinnamate dioxygenase ferredoxin subunit